MFKTFDNFNDILKDGLLVSGSWEGELKFWDHASSDACVLDVQGVGGIMCICILSEGGFVTGDQVAAILANINKNTYINSYRCMHL